MNIQPLGWIDTSLAWANFRLRYYDLMKVDQTDPFIHTFPLIDSGEPHAAMEKFGSMKSLLGRLRNAGAAFLGGAPAEIVHARIESLIPDSHTVWSQDDDTDHLQFRVALTNPPNAWLYCGGEAAQLAPGVVNYVNTAALHCAVNFSDAPCVHLLARVKRPDVS